VILTVQIFAIPAGWEHHLSPDTISAGLIKKGFVSHVMNFQSAFVWGSVVVQAIEANRFFHQGLLSAITVLPEGHWWVRLRSVESTLGRHAGDHAKVLGKCGDIFTPACAWAFGEIVPVVVSENVKDTRQSEALTQSFRQK
jgi:hypothetical protein